MQISFEMIHYGMTRIAQVAIARELAETTAGTGVTVNSVLTGPTASEGVKDFLEQVSASRKTNSRAAEKEFFNSVRSTSLLKRFASPEEVAAVVALVPCLPRPMAPRLAAGGVVRAGPRSSLWNWNGRITRDSPHGLDSCKRTTSESVWPRRIPRLRPSGDQWKERICSRSKLVI